jgi:hypothetical protein
MHRRAAFQKTTAARPGTAAGGGDDIRIDIGSGPTALRNISIRGATLSWDNNGRSMHARLGRVSAG